MAQSIIYFICGLLVIFAAGVFAPFVISTLKKINTKTDSIPKHHWSIGIYMEDIPQNEQNTLHLGSVPLRIYERGKYSDLPIPREGEKVYGVYVSGKDKFELTGIVVNVFYNVNIDCIVVSCKCTEIVKEKRIYERNDSTDSVDALMIEELRIAMKE